MSRDNADFRVRGLEPEALKRLNQAVKQAGSVRNIARLSNIPISTLSGALSGSSDLRSSAMAQIARACGVSLDWLFFGEDTERKAILDSPAQPDAAQYVAVPRFDATASAGFGCKLFEEPPISFWQVPKEMLVGFELNLRELASINVEGDSMEPSLQDGEPIIFDRSQKSIGRSGVFVLTIGDELFVKRLRRVPTSAGEVALSLISDNPAYPEVLLESDTQDRIRVHGRVVWPKTLRRV